MRAAAYFSKGARCSLQPCDLTKSGSPPPDLSDTVKGFSLESRNLREGWTGTNEAQCGIHGFNNNVSAFVASLYMRLYNDRTCDVKCSNGL